jgi:hypothetical protein
MSREGAKGAKVKATLQKTFAPFAPSRETIPPTRLQFSRSQRERAGVRENGSHNFNLAKKSPDSPARIISIIFPPC